MLVKALSRLFATLLCLSFFGAPALSNSGEKLIPFEDLAASFKEEHCAKGASCDLEEVLLRNYLQIPAGVFEFVYPTQFLADKKRAKEIQELTIGLLDVQRVWIAWLAKDTTTVDGALADINVLKDWVDGWNLADIKRNGPKHLGDFHAVVGSSEAVKTANERLAALMHDVEKLGLGPNRPGSLRIGCCPTRRNFMEFVGYCGVMKPAWQESYWIDGIDQWTELWVDSIPFIALEYAPWEDLDITFSRGLSMKKFDKTGLIEHFTEHAALALMRFCFTGDQKAHFEKAMAMNVAIEICGQVNTVDGEGGISQTGAKTQPYSRFVPGGNPNGGILPPMSAAPLAGIQANHWRELLGADRFAKALRKGQKDGAKKAKKDRENPLAKDKYAHFLLEAAEGGAKQTVSAPFFGAAADLKQYPDQAVIKDYRQFFRSYKCGFFHWIQTGFGKDPAESRAKFNQLMASLARSGGDSSKTDEVFQEVYGIPISSASGDVDNLEWRYLTWLGTGK